MKKRILGLLLVIVSVGLIFALAACNKEDNRQIPVYQGMTISSVNNRTIASSAPFGSRRLLAANNNSNNGNQYGWYEDEDIDQDNPFGDKADSIEQVVDSTLKVTGSAQSIYHATPNEDIYITIHVSNPDNFEIMSFTLNGNKYSSYMFEQGSDMEHLILKLNVGNVSGIVKFTIDAIKYIDGREIKDVLIDGDQVVCAGVSIANQVRATVKETVGFNDITLQVNVSDNDGLVEYSNGSLKAVLFDGDTLVAVKDISVGESTVTFDGLATASLYQYAIVGYYDNLKDSFGMHILYKKALCTDYIVVFDNVTVTQEGVSFDFKWNEKVQGYVIKELHLIKDGKDTELNDTLRTVTGLLSDNEYTLVAYYDNNQVSEQIYLNFHTQAKATPTVTVSIDNITQTGFDFAVNVYDTDSVGTVGKIQLLNGNDTVNIDDLSVRHFDRLLANSDYTLRITYVYDLNDGKGEREIIKTVSITTLANIVPTVEISNLFVTEELIKADLFITDISSVGFVEEIKLTGENTYLVNQQQIEFDGLTYGKSYEIRVTYKYDLSDGIGEQTIVKILTVTIDSKTIHETSCILDYGQNEYGTFYIAGYSNCSHEEIYIPDTIDGKSIIAIGAYAFRNCQAKKIIIGEGVEEIGERAFYACTNLTEFTIPETIYTVESQIFIGCKSLEIVYYNCNASRDDSVLNISSIKTVVFGDNLTKIPDNVCYNCTNIENVILSKNTKTIGKYAFYNCTSLKEIEFPEGLEYTGWYAFEYAGLTHITLPSTVTSVDNSFRECYNLVSVVIPTSLRKIEGQAFYVCNNLKEKYYMGSDFEWEAVSVDPINTHFINATVFFYSETQPTEEGNFWHYEDKDIVVW